MKEVSILGLGSSSEWNASNGFPVDVYFSHCHELAICFYQSCLCKSNLFCILKTSAVLSFLFSQVECCFWHLSSVRSFVAIKNNCQ